MGNGARKKSRRKDLSLFPHLLFSEGILAIPVRAGSGQVAMLVDKGILFAGNISWIF